MTSTYDLDPGARGLGLAHDITSHNAKNLSQVILKSLEA
jgi:hypothetical protein